MRKLSFGDVELLADLNAGLYGVAAFFLLQGADGIGQSGYFSWVVGGVGFVDASCGAFGGHGGCRCVWECGFCAGVCRVSPPCWGGGSRGQHSAVCGGGAACWWREASLEVGRGLGVLRLSGGGRGASCAGDMLRCDVWDGGSMRWLFVGGGVVRSGWHEGCIGMGGHRD